MKWIYCVGSWYYNAQAGVAEHDKSVGLWDTKRYASRIDPKGYTIKRQGGAEHARSPLTSTNVHFFSMDRHHFIRHYHLFLFTMFSSHINCSSPCLHHLQGIFYFQPASFVPYTVLVPLHTQGNILVTSISCFSVPQSSLLYSLSFS